MKFSDPKHIFQHGTLTLRKALNCIEMTPQKVQKLIHNIIIPENILFIFLTPPQKKKEIKNFEPPKVDRTYLYMIILEYPPPSPSAES